MEDQNADFSGWATKSNLQCSDGRTIKAGAFKHMDKVTVPLVWQHQHDNPENILGHALLEDRAFGTYVYAFFNSTPRGQHMKEAVKHKDVTALSIYANNLSERKTSSGKEVYHGDIKEVSLVVAGANPGALIENINMVHGDQFEVLDEEAIIYTGLELEHSEEFEKEAVMAVEDNEKAAEEIISHATATATADAEDTSTDDSETLKDIYDSLSKKQEKMVLYLLDQALGSDEAAASDDSSAAHSDDSDSAVTTDVEDASEKDLAHLDEDAQNAILAHVDEKIETVKKGLTDMTRNLFEQNDSTVSGSQKKTLSHSLIETIMEDAKSSGSLKDAFIAHAGAEYGIEDIDFLFPDAKSLTNSPDFLARRTEWVASVLGESKHSPFSRIKSVVADITADEARAKGYVKGNLKKNEIIKLLKRVTVPTTIYKKQKLDRDDVIDITDLDVVAWLKAEMRVMLDEEVARAILVGDGREPDDEDKVDEEKLRPIAFDADMYSEKVNLASNVSPADFEEGILRARAKYRGTGIPTMYTTDSYLTDLMLQKDTTNRRIYKDEAELAAALRVSNIVVVEVMEDTPDILAILVNMTDYTIGADRGGQIAMFDDFDIDYNQYKYLMESRISGALTKPKSALVVRRAPGNIVTPTQPQYDSATHVITIPAVTGVIYSIDGTDVTAGALPAITETTEVEARPAAGYSFPHNTDADWVFVF